MNSINKLSNIELQEVDIYFKTQLKEQRELMKKHYKEQRELMKKHYKEQRELMKNHYKEQQEIDNYFKNQLIRIILKKSPETKEKLEGAELGIPISIDSFPKRCHNFILNKPKEND
jgi:predicted ATPase with chaperone activity